MTYTAFPEVDTATQALEQLITTTEREIEQMKGAINEKKRLIKSSKKRVLSR